MDLLRIRVFPWIVLGFIDADDVSHPMCIMGIFLAVQSQVDSAAILLNIACEIIFSCLPLACCGRF